MSLKLYKRRYAPFAKIASKRAMLLTWIVANTPTVFSVSGIGQRTSRTHVPNAKNGFTC